MAVPAEKQVWIGDDIFENQEQIAEAEKAKKRPWAMKLAEDAKDLPGNLTRGLSGDEEKEANTLFREILEWVAKTGNVREGTKEILGISHYSIWKWRTGKNPITQKGLEKLREAVSRIREIEKQKKDQALAAERKKIIQTSTVKIVSELLAESVENRDKGFYMVGGQSGQGKTKALEYALANGPYEKFMPGLPATEGKTRYILLKGSENTRPAEMVRKICHKLGLRTGSNSSQNLEIISDFLMDNPILIIVDESDWWHRRQWLNIFREIWQDSQTPIFLLGCPRFMEELLRPEDQYRQLNARIAMKYRFQAISLEEVMPFFKEAGCDVWAKDTIEEVYAISGGNLHDLLQLMDKVKTVGAINPAVSISPEFVRIVKKQFLS